MDQKFKDNLARTLGIPPEEQKIIDETESMDPKFVHELHQPGCGCCQEDFEPERKDAPPEIREAIKRACLAGNVVPNNEEAFTGLLKNMATGNFNWTLTDAQVESCWGPWKNENGGNDGGFSVQWATKEAGFGSLTFYRKDGKLRCDSETTSREFIKEVINHLLDEVIIDRDD